MLKFENVEKRYASGSAALAGVSFTVPEGQFCVILGPSGAGKSTLLRTVNGLVEPSAGQVFVGDVRVSAKTLRTLRPRIGMIHQHFGLVARSSVATNVLAGALPVVSTLRALSGAFPAYHRARAAALVQDVGLAPEYLARRVSALSGGQQQRVGIARAFMLDPVIVLADEPVASLDPKISRDILGALKRQSRERRTTVLCSLHDLGLARSFADRIVALRAGRIAFDGPADKLDGATVQAIYGGLPGIHDHPDASEAAH